jgi:adenylate cyclase
MSATREERHLAVILAIDVVGYSRMMGADESGTFAQLKALRQKIFEPKAEQYGGRTFKNTGDGALIEFPSAVHAVQCAVEMQKALEDRNADEPADRRIDLRIGVNLGDVLVDDGDVFGDGVNVAARLEGLARPGSICISENVYRLVRTKLEANFEDLGENTLKNIAEPVQAYLILPPDASPEKASSDGPQAELPAVAVLPFDNMSGDAEQEYFADGLTEDIITALSQWRSIPVIARNSTFTYKGQSVRVQTVAEELGVRYVLEGSVRKAGNRLRITAQLIDAETGHHVWAEKFDRQIEDIFDVQDEITTRIAGTIIPELESFENRRSAIKRTEDLNAWDFYLRGMQTFYDETCEGTAESLEMFQSAVEADANYCDAWARLGWSYSKIIMHDCTDDLGASLRKGFEAARRSIALDDASALAHMSLGMMHIWAGETKLGLAEGERALDLNPNFAHAAMAVGNRLDLVGQTEEGIAQMERALTLNPRDPIRWRYMAYLARAYLSLEDYEQAAEWGQKAALLRPDLPEALFRYAVCVAHLDRADEARDLIAQCSAIDPGYVAKRAEWRPYPDEKRNAHIMDGLRRHNLLSELKPQE